jgi:isoleucyl-tRNA synthetase
VDDFNSCMSNGMDYKHILNPVQGNGVYAADCPVRRPAHLEGRARHPRRPEGRGPPDGHHHHQPQLPALLAPQDARDLPRRRPVVHPHGRRRRRVHRPAQKPEKTLRQIALDAIEQTSFYPKTARTACAT